MFAIAEIAQKNLGCDIRLRVNCLDIQESTTLTHLVTVWRCFVGREPKLLK